MIEKKPFVSYTEEEERFSKREVIPISLNKQERKDLEEAKKYLTKKQIEIFEDKIMKKHPHIYIRG